MSTFYSRPQRNWRQCLRKILRVKQCVLWRFDIDSLEIGLPVVLYTDKIHKHTTWQPSNQSTVTKTKCRLSSTIRYHWQQKLESVRFSCASATSLSFPERKKSMFWLFPRFPVSSSQTLINMHNSNQQFTKPLTCEIINNNFWTLELMSSSLGLNPWDF